MARVHTRAHVTGWYLIIKVIGYQPSVVRGDDVASPGAAVSYLAPRAGDRPVPGSPFRGPRSRGGVTPVCVAAREFRLSVHPGHGGVRAAHRRVTGDP